MKSKILLLIPAALLALVGCSNKEETKPNDESSQQGDVSGGESSDVESFSTDAEGYKTVDFVPADFGEAMNEQGSFEATSKGLTLTATNSKLHLEYNSQKIELRVYSGGTIKFTATSIKSIQFTCTAENDDKYGPGCLSASTGSYTTSGYVGTWTGEVASVTFTAESLQTRIKSFTVSYK